MARDYVAEIAELRARSSGASSPVYEITRLRVFWEESGKKDLANDLVVIRLVTIIEVATRDWISSLIDRGEPFVGRAEGLFEKSGTKISFSTAKAITGKIVSIGELIAHTVNVSSFATIVASLTTLFGQDLRILLMDIRNPFPRETKDTNPLIIENMDVDFSLISSLFDCRHVVVHELPIERAYKLDDLDGYLSAARHFTESAELLVAQSIGNLAFTQAEMNEQAHQRAEEFDAQLQTILQTLDPAGNDPELRSAQKAWERYRKLHADFRSGITHPSPGSIAPMNWSMTYAETTRQRIEELDWMTGPD